MHAVSATRVSVSTISHRDIEKPHFNYVDSSRRNATARFPQRNTRPRADSSRTFPTCGSRGISLRARGVADTETGEGTSTRRGPRGRFIIIVPRVLSRAISFRCSRGSGRILRDNERGWTESCEAKPSEVSRAGSRIS